MNPEISASLTSKQTKKDSHMLELQKIAGSSLMAVGTILTILMNDKECDKLQIVSLVNDVAKLSIQMHHAISVSRRANIFIPNLSPQVAVLIKKAEIGETLFGNKLAERIKESKALAKLSEEIKEKPKPFSTPRKQFLSKGPQQRGPLSQQSGYNRANYQNKPMFKSKQYYFNSKSHKQNNTSQKNK